MRRFFYDNRTTVIVGAISILICIGYFIIVYLYSKDEIWEVTTSFVTTIFSIIVGTMITILVFNYQGVQQNNDKRQVLVKCLTSEIVDTYQVLNDGEGMTVNGKSFLVTFIQPIILEECAKSGLFDATATENFLHVSRKIRFYTLQVNCLLTILSQSDNSDFKLLLDHFHKSMTQTKIALLENFEQILKVHNINAVTELRRGQK